MDLKTLIYKTSQPIASIELRRKKVYLFALRTTDISAISQLNSENTSAEKYKSILRVIASNKKPSKTNLERVLLTEDFINSLSEAELNSVAQTYLETPYVKNINEKLKNPLQKNTGEEDIQYLHRLLSMYVTDYNEKQKEMMSSMLDPFRSVREASSILSKKIDTYSFSSPPVVEQAMTAHKQRIEELEMARVTAEMSKESANLLNKLTIDVTNFLENWRKETDKNNETTKTQLKIAVGSLIVSALLSGLALCYSYKSYVQDMRSNKESDESQRNIINLLNETNKNSSVLVKQNANLEHHISELIKNQKTEQQNLQDKPKEHTNNLAQ